VQVAKYASPYHSGENMLRKAILFLVLFVLAVVSACRTVPSPVSPTTVPPATLTESSTIALPLVTSTSDFSAYKTRVAQQDQDRINELLMTNSGCDLPCWWGIKPGITELADVDRLMKELGAFGSVLEGKEYRLPDGTLAREVGFDRFYSSESISIIFGIQNNSIQSIKVERNVSFGDETIPKIYWKAYSLNHIFEKYGKPDKIWVKNYPSILASSTDDITIFVFYDKLKFMIAYSMHVEITDPMLICPSFDDGQIGRFNLYIVSSSQNITLEEYANFVPDREEYTLPIEKVSGLSIQEFYDSLLSGHGCVETPRKIWH